MRFSGSGMRNDLVVLAPLASLAGTGASPPASGASASVWFGDFVVEQGPAIPELVDLAASVDAERPEDHQSASFEVTLPPGAALRLHGWVVLEGEGGAVRGAAMPG